MVISDCHECGVRTRRIFKIDSLRRYSLAEKIVLSKVVCFKSFRLNRNAIDPNIHHFVVMYLFYFHFRSKHFSYIFPCHILVASLIYIWLAGILSMIAIMVARNPILLHWSEYLRQSHLSQIVAFVIHLRQDLFVLLLATYKEIW